jgi:GAF domain-containing protein
VHRDVDGVRAVIYETNQTGDGLDVVKWSKLGHRLAPNPFVPGTDRCAKAMELLRSGAGSLFVDDIRSAPADRWAGSGTGYNTFISCPITSPSEAYGLLTVDAPLTDDLTEEDENDLRLIAGILAMLFAEYRRRPRKVATES